MKHKFLSLLVALFATTILWASNTITYTATEDLSAKYYLKVGATTFGPAITSHTFSNGTGTITCSEEITTIGEYAFQNCSGLTSVTIPNSVKTIGEYAFYACSGLTSITIPNSVTTIGEHAFGACIGLTSPVYNANCFAYMPHSYEGAYIIPNGIKQIAGSAFYGCRGLTSITIPNSVTTIGEYAFYACNGLTSVEIPNSVTTIGSNAFDNVSNIVYSGTATGSPWGAKCVNGYVDGYLVYSDATKTTLCGCYATATGEIFIPNSVKTIGDRAFEGFYDLNSITIPNSVTTIGYCAFAYCSGLTSVAIPNSVTTIGSDAFRDCIGLTSPVYNANCFAYMPHSYEGAYIIPNGIKQIAGSAFYDCRGLNSVTIPNSVTTIGSSAFSYCSGLTSVAIPNSVTTIRKYTFSRCSSLTSVTIPNSVTTIEDCAFNGCSGLTSVIIPNSVTTIGNDAFAYCSGLTSITSYVTTPPACGSYCFSGVYIDIPVYVPSQSVAAYKQANEWKEFTNIQSVDQGQCGADLYWQYNDGILVISGTGAMYDYTQDSAPWILFQDSINSFVINNGCISIGNFAFYGLSNKNLKTIDIPNSVEQIGQFAFANCEYLKNVYFGLSLEKISANAFVNDERLLYITCYAIEPPLLDESAFVNYDAYLSVPCESQADYKVAKGWKKFNKENVSCIGAEETTVTKDDVTVVPTDNQATLTWPADDQAAGYSIEITKDGVVFCTLKFNAQGQLTGIAFAPSRGGEQRTMQAAEMTAKGWQFTVTGLNQASKYSYTIDALNASQQPIKHYQGEFYTDGYTGLEQLTVDNAQCTIRKMIIDNQLFIFRGGKIFNAAGRLIK